MNIYDNRNAFLNDIIYPISPAYEHDLSAFLHSEISGNNIVEFGVGTGRIAFPLADHGYNVVGVDRSVAMLAELNNRDENGVITQVNGDFSATLDMPHNEYDAVLLVCNAIFEATELHTQRGVFRNARNLINSDGIFAVETINPLPLLKRTEARISTRALTSDMYLIEQTDVDPYSQWVTTLFIIFDSSTAPYSYRQSIRLMTPREMDAIAASEGLMLRSRMGWWNGSPASASSDRIISIYEREDF